jgi:hypothetical protein
MNVLIAFFLGMVTAITNLQKPNNSSGGKSRLPTRPEHDLRAGLQIPTAVGLPVQAEQKTTRLEWTKLWLQVAEVVVLGGYTLVTLALWFTAREANQQTKTLLKSQNRAWVGLKAPIQITQPPSFQFYSTNNVLMLGLALRTTNFGHSPALKNQTLASLAVIEDEKQLKTRLSRELELMCFSAAGTGRDEGGAVLFPSGEIVNPIGGLATFSPTFHHIRRTFLIGCTAYQDTDGSTHYSKFIFRSTFPDGAKPVRADSTHDLTYMPITGFELWSEEAD